VAMIDDATSQAYRRFVAQDSTEENLRLLEGYPERLGHHWRKRVIRNLLMTQPYLIKTTVQLHAREASVAQRLRSNGVRGLEADFGGAMGCDWPFTSMLIAVGCFGQRQGMHRQIHR